jgi:hypothetical protein
MHTHEPKDELDVAVGRTHVKAFQITNGPEALFRILTPCMQIMRNK